MATQTPAQMGAELTRGSIVRHAEQLLAWSWKDPAKHPKDRLTDHQALDIATRVVELETQLIALQAQTKGQEMTAETFRRIASELGGIAARIGG